MRSLKNPFRFDDRRPAFLPQALFLLYLMGECATDSRYKLVIRLAILFAGATGIVWPAPRQWPLYWLGLTALLCVNVAAFYDQAANHHFLTVYVSAFFLVDSVARQRDRSLPINVPRAFLVLTFGFAMFQKFLSEFFMSGRSIATYVLEAKSLYPLLTRLYPSHVQAVADYKDAFGCVADGALLGTSVAAVDVASPAFVTLCRALALTIVAAEGAVFLAIVVKRLFYSSFSPVILVAFVFGTFIFRQEIFFFILVCIVFMLSRPNLSPAWRNTYIGIILFLFAFGIAGLRTLF